MWLHLASGEAEFDWSCRDYQREEGSSLNLWAALDQLNAVTSASRRRTRSEELVDQIADALATAGSYVARADLLPTEQVLDLNWAAHQAARRLGIRIQIQTHGAKTPGDGPAQIRISQLQPPG